MSFKRSRKFKALILASGKVIEQLVNVAIAAVLTRVFLKSEYATYRQTFLAFDMVAPLLTLGIPFALYYFMPKRKKASRAVIVENLLILLVSGLLFSSFLIIGGDRFLAWRFSNPGLRETLLYIVPFAIFELMSRTVAPCLISKDRPLTAAIFNISTRCALFFLGTGAALLFQTTTSVVIAAVLVSALRFVVGMVLVWSVTAQTDSSPNWSGVKSQLKYGVPLGVAGAFGTLTMSLDKFVVASMCDAEAFAVYTVGAFELPFTALLTSSITAVLLADLSSFHLQGKFAKGVDLWGRSAVKCSMIVLPMMAALFVLAPLLIEIVFSEKYADSVVPFRIYLLLIPIRIVNYGSMIMSAGASKLILIWTIVAFLLNLISSVVLTNFLGANGAAIATVAVTYLFVVPFNLIAISYLWKISPKRVLPWQQLGLVFAITGTGSLLFLISQTFGVGGEKIGSLFLLPLFGVAVIALFAITGLMKRHFPEVNWKMLGWRH